MKSRILNYSILLACAWLGVSCRQVESPRPARVEDTNAVAVVAGTVIPAEALRAELQRQVRYATDKDLTTEQKLAALETLVRNESIYAKVAAFDQTPEIQERIRNLIINQFKEQQFKRRCSPFWNPPRLSRDNQRRFRPVGSSFQPRTETER